jgi:hypothetical protein
MLPTLDRINRADRQENLPLGKKYDPKKFSHFITFGNNKNIMFAYLSKKYISIGD